MGFAYRRGMGYGLLRTYGLWYAIPPATQVGGWLKLWGMGGYGLSEVWVIRGLTVPHTQRDLHTIWVVA
jgi:hypothetical protein